MPTALVTGSTSGIGAEFARRYGAAHHDLVLVARDKTRLDAQAAELTARYGIEAAVLVADLSTDGGCALVEARVADGGRPIDVLVNNAGFGLGKDFMHSTLEDEEQLMRVLMRAPMRITKAALPGMVGRNTGVVITVSSVAAYLNYSTYGAAKRWALRFSETLSRQLTGTGVRAIALCPGLVHTEFHQRGKVEVGRTPQWLWLDVGRVVDECLRDLQRGKLVCIPSRRYKVLISLGRLMPPALVVAIRNVTRKPHRPAE
jgi:uncharacterized protein